MGKFISPTFGFISGKHGTAVAAITKNGNILRLHKKPGNPNTPKQQEQRLKFGLVNTELAPLNEVFKKGYLSPDGRSMAISHALKNAIEGEFPDFTINFEHVQVAAGTLPGVQQISATVDEASDGVTVTWDTTVGFQGSEEDPVNLVFYNRETRLSFLYEHVADRQAGTLYRLLPEVWKGKAVHCWLYLSAKNRNVNSNSVYVGLLQL